MNECKDCYYYDDSNTFYNTGYCIMQMVYVKSDDDYCEDYEEKNE